MTAALVDGPVTAADLQRLMGAAHPLSEEQMAAVTAPLGPQLILAGAGSGKTTVMAARVVWLVATGRVAPESVLGLTFTAKAAGELRSRIDDALGAAGLLDPPERDGGAEGPTVATYNSYAAGLLTEHGLRIGHEPDTRVLADASRYQLAGRVIDRHTAPVEQLSDHPPTVINNLLALDSAMSEHLVAPEDVRAFQDRERPCFEQALAEAESHRRDIADVVQTMARREELLALVESYRAHKRELGLMDFSDQIELAARLSARRPDVGAAERERFRVVLLDEYQDTSVAQALMLCRLFSGPEPGLGRGHPVTAVGDPNQAIYGWRGASVSNILGFGRAFPGASGVAEAPTYSLAVNRRSGREILAVANRLAEPLHQESPQVRPLRPDPDAPTGQVRVAVHETDSDELAWLPGQVRRARTDLGVGWSGVGVLARDNAHAALVFDALTAEEIPVEIVGLQGLLRLPEVAEVVASLTLLHDLTANAELLTLLTGPRWAIGPRDLALLGARARDLAHVGPPGPASDAGASGTAGSLEEVLSEAVGGADPTEVVSLCDALEDPGEGEYSAEARERFGLLAGELRALRRHTGEPLLDLVRRIVDTTGLDVELDSSVSPAARARRENLDLFVKAVGEFQAVDGQVSLPALLAYLQAEDEMGTGLDVATPSATDSVKLLTVHRAKGLEWDAVFLVGVCAERFPNTRGRTKWTKGPAVLPSPLRGDAGDQPRLVGHDYPALKRLGEETKDHEALEELRLGYVAFTRPRALLVVSSYCWTAQRKTGLGPSPYQEAVRDHLVETGGQPELWRDRPAKEDANPATPESLSRPWPAPGRTHEVERRLAAAEEVRRAVREHDAHPDADPALRSETELDADEAARVAQWDSEATRLLEEARSGETDEVVVPMPSSVSATALARLRDDPEGFARDLARPMPRPPSPAARFGTRFHAWVEARFGQPDLLDPDDLPGRADAGIDDEDDLAELVAAFEAGPFGDRIPVAVEPAFALVLAGQVVRGRIDAVYAEDDGGYLVVDWKTSRHEGADPLQLALYRLAWAELAGVSPGRVRAAFYYVRTQTVRAYAGPGLPDLPDRPELESLLG